MEPTTAEGGPTAGTARSTRIPVMSLVAGLALCWTVVALASLFWNVKQVRDLVLDQAEGELRTNFFKDLTFRRWATRHGGVYVPVTGEQRPDPYVAHLPERDVVTPSGRVLTLINPALMVRQFNELAGEGYGARGHLSGLRPLNPNNVPDAWEAEALRQLVKGKDEVTGIAEIEGAPYMRLIRPMVMKGNCLACHARQGYREGDIAGGVSVSVPLAPLNATADDRVASLAAGHGLLWLLGIVGIAVGGRQLDRRVKESDAAYRALEEHQGRTRAILGASLDGIIAIDGQNRIVDWSRQAEVIFGWSREEVLGLSLSDTIIPEDFRARHEAGLARQLKTGESHILNRRVEVTGLHRSGREFPIELSIARISSSGEPCFSAYVRDISQRKQAEDKRYRDYHTQRVLAELLALSMQSDPFEERLQRALELILSTPWLSLEGTGSIFLVDETSGHLTMSAKYGLSDTIEKNCATVALGHCLCGRAALQRELIFTNCVDHRHDVSYPGMVAHGHYCAPILFEDSLLGVLNLYVDEGHQESPEEVQFITAAAHVIGGMIQRCRAERKLWHYAYHDGLTDMPNRTLFLDRLEHRLRQADRHPDQRCAVLFLDIDRFKTVNDSLGHAVGDRLLLEVSRRILEAVRPQDTVARMGGDEFTVLLETVESPADALRVADRLHAALEPPIVLDGHEVFVSASVGVALAQGGHHAADLLRDADTAMYRAKSHGLSQTALFDEKMHLRAVAQLTLENELRRAVEGEELSVYYQPIVNATTRAPLGFEALVRWEHPERGFVSPGEFIPVAEETGLIGDIGEWVLEQACRQLCEWRTSFPQWQGLYLTVNLSAKQLLQPDFLECVDRIIATSGVDPRCLGLEITESVLMHNREAAHRILGGLKARGLHLYLDDFGTGYSSLGYLQNFPFDALKIDRSFVSRLMPTTGEAEMVSTIIAIARNFSMDVIAEGVESGEQLDRIIALGCSKVQGYYFAPALPAAAVAALVLATPRSARN